MKRSVYIFLLVFAVIVTGGATFYFIGTPRPDVALSPNAGPIAARKELTVKLDAPRSVLKKLAVTAVQEGRTVDVVTKSFTGVDHARETFTLVQAGLKEGPFKLQVTVTAAPKHFGADRTTTLAIPCEYENKPPEVTVLSPAHNITRGGAGLVVYTLSKEVEKTGVVFADQFVPGYRQGGTTYACLFPFPYNMNPDQFVPRVMAVDRAGNEQVVGITYHLTVKPFPTDRIVLSDAFLEKVAAEFKGKFPQASSPLEVFLKANGELRQQDARTLLDYGRTTSPVPLWQGEFLRLPNSAPRGAFAQARTYVYQGKTVDRQTHLGVDLASLAHAPVPAANRGRVVHAGDLGLYGQCVVIDHGLGLQTLYGHLSRIGVKVGDNVEKGQIIGNTGATGMAGGDHLHFGVNVAGQSVNPIEWWDPSWLKNNITGKLDIGKPATAK